MTFLSVLYVLGGLAVGIIVGMIIELGIETNTNNELHRRIETLQLENEALRQEAPAQVVEILDRRSVDASSLFDPW